MPVEVQTRDGTDNFTGTADEGLFTWENLDKLPPTSRVILETVCLRILGDATNPFDVARVFLRPRGAGNDDASVSLAFVTGAQADNPDNSADLVTLVSRGGSTVTSTTDRMRAVPRTVSGEHWELAFVTTDKARKGFAIVDWRVEPFGPAGL